MDTGPSDALVRQERQSSKECNVVCFFRKNSFGLKNLERNGFAVVIKIQNIFTL